MRRIRVVPLILLQNGRMVKSIKFKNPIYLGDPINAVRIFNDKEVDEIVILDISATKENRNPDIEKVSELAGEAFMPLAYGGGIKTIDQVKELLYQGAEKVIFNSCAVKNPSVIEESVRQFGSSSIVVSIDVKKDWLGRSKVFIENGKTNTGLDPVVFANSMEKLGVGEILLTSIERDGMLSGYDIELLQKVSTTTNIPIIACGGASQIEDFVLAIRKGGASAVAAGSMFVFQMPHRAVLISYPTQSELKSQLFNKI